MDKAQIIDTLKDIAVFLELKGENVFKIKTYQKTARALQQSEADLNLLIKEKRLKESLGISESMAEKIVEWHQTGESKLYLELRDSFPKGLLDLLKIRGLGPKKVKAIYDALHITSIEALEAACLKKNLEKIEGFGTITQQNILSAVQNYKIYSKSHLWWSAFVQIDPVFQQLLKLPQVIKADYAGAFRRKQETVECVLIVVAAESLLPIVEWFKYQNCIYNVTASTVDEIEFQLEDDLSVYVKIVKPELFYVMLIEYTGSSEHVKGLKEKALEKNIKWSEVGSLPEIESESDFYDRLGLPFIIPELREDAEIIAYASNHCLPEYIKESDIKGVFHVHTTYSDGHNTLEEMVQAAENCGWEYMCINDHSKSSIQANGLSEERLLKQIETIKALNQSKRYKIHVFAGSECDILTDGSLDYDAEILKQLDCVVVSVHSSFSLSEAAMTERIIKAIENPYTTMLGHATGRLLLRRESYPVNLEKIIDAAIRNKVIIELNANPYRLDMDWRHWGKAAEKGLMTSINPDAHNTDSLAYYKAGIHIARKGGLSCKHVLNTRSLEDVKKILSQRR
jgi:DNA polymerase (family 10)